jgi:sarcosine oxidase / L-pipecolate oxidase
MFALSAHLIKNSPRIASISRTVFRPQLPASFRKNMATASSPSYLIIGAGVFGASTAYHLAKKHPGTSISLVDRTPYPCPLGASWDWNKVVRADYGDLFYMEKALEAIQLWLTDPLYKPFYHQSGLVNIDNTGLGKKIVENYKKLKSDSAPELISVEAFKQRYDGFFHDTDFKDVEEVFVNEKSGWAEAAKALKALIDATLELGVKYVEGEVSTLTFNEAGDCSGIQLNDGRASTADKIILSTGALTAKLIADSAPKRLELQVGDRIIAGAVITGIVNLSAQEGKKYTEIPVTVHGIHSTQGTNVISPLCIPFTNSIPVIAN